ncbi:glutathione S-transferase [Fomitopsis serialis]|uniref:glutathione S-transferase n=1 Tax=Fomitopsis serialis TaxID=139415 RepID=UPI00200779C3|nr:glutathione S-transferase [Neoantrodia serialis]KAH9922404.1 glutathione S-transferase [Neoantrodia serialis]
MIKLYGYPPSHATRRAALIFKELGLPYELVKVDMTTEAHKAAPYLAQQPFGQVPYIDDDGLVLFESRAIARYLVAKYARPEHKALMPTPAGDLERFARFEQAVSVEMSNFDVYMGALSWEVIFKRYTGVMTDEAIVTDLLQTLNSKLDAYEVLLAKNRYLAGDEVTLADLFHLPFGNTLGSMGYDLLTTSSRPNVSRWWKDISSRPAWQAVKENA